MAEQLKVLISAYACEPNKGSEPEVGWQWALQMARYHDITVLTRSNNQPAIEAELARIGDRQPLPKFVYHDRGPLLLEFKRRTRTLKLYYLLWQRSAREIIARLHEAHRFDLMHHVTFAAFRYPTAIWGHGVPCIWGPIGGIESIPVRLLPWHHPRSLLGEILRNTHNLIQSAPFNVLPARTRASTLILASTREMQHAFAAIGVAAELMPAIGLNIRELPYRAHKETNAPLRLLFVGNIITLKGIDLALEALKASETEATLTLIGTGDYLEAAKGLAKKLGFQDRVRFAGRLPREEVLKIYPDYDAFIFPSLHDTGGYAVIEAMFNELPVIALDCGGPAVAVRDGCGIRVRLDRRAKVISGLADAIRRYDHDRSLVRVEGWNARENILKNYDWDLKGEQMSSRYQAAVQDPVASKNSGRSPEGYSGMGGFLNLMHGVLSLRGLLVTALSLVLIGALCFLTIGHLKHEADAIVNDTLPSLSYAGQANAYLAQAFNRTLILLMTEDPAERHRMRQEIEDSSQGTTGFLNAYKQAINSAEDQARFNHLIRTRANYLRIRVQTLDLMDAGQRDKAVELCKAQLLPAYVSYKEAADKIFEFNMDEGRSRGKSIMVVSTITQFVVAIIGIMVFILGFLIGLSR